MNRPHPIARAAATAAEAVVDLAAIGLFILAVYVVAGLFTGRI